jgi:hypothetical protein
LVDLKLGIFAAIETVTPQMLQKIWKEIEYLFDILSATDGTHIEVVWHCSVIIL